MRIFCKDGIEWDPLAVLFGNGKKNGLPPGWTDSSDPGLKTVSRDEVERLLIKLSRQGINALTEEEQETLRKAREEMMNQR